MKKNREKIMFQLLGGSALIASATISVTAQACQDNPIPAPSPRDPFSTIINGVNLLDGYNGTVPSGVATDQFVLAESVLSGAQVVLTSQNHGTNVIIESLNFTRITRSSIVTNVDDTFLVIIHNLVGTARNDIVNNEINHVVLGDMSISVADVDGELNVLSIEGIDFGQNLVNNAFSELSIGYTSPERNTISSNALSLLEAFEKHTNEGMVARINPFLGAINAISVELQTDGTISVRLGTAESNPSNGIITSFFNDSWGTEAVPEIYANQNNNALVMEDITINTNGSLNTESALIFNYDRDVLASQSVGTLYGIRQITNGPPTDVSQRHFWDALLVSAGISSQSITVNTLTIIPWQNDVFQGNAAQYNDNGTTITLFGNTATPSVSITVTENGNNITYTNRTSIVFSIVFDSIPVIQSVSATGGNWIQNT